MSIARITPSPKMMIIVINVVREMFLSTLGMLAEVSSDNLWRSGCVGGCQMSSSASRSQVSISAARSQVSSAQPGVRCHQSSQEPGVISAARSYVSSAQSGVRCPSVQPGLRCHQRSQESGVIKAARSQVFISTARSLRGPGPSTRLCSFP